MRVIRLILTVSLIFVLTGSLFAGSFHPSNFEGKEITNGIRATNILPRGNVVTITETFVINRTTIDPLTGKRGQYGFDANVYVAPGGTLKVENATIYFLSDEEHPYNLTVKGNLYLYNATVTIGGGLIKPHYPFSINIGGTVVGEVKIIKSKLLYPGWFNVSNKNGNVIIINSTFDKMHGGTLDNPPPFGPIPYIKNSKIFILNTSFKSLPKWESSGSGSIGYAYNNTEITLGSSGGLGATHEGNLTYGNFKKKVYSEYEKFWEYVVLKDFVLKLAYTNDSQYDEKSLLQVIYKGRYRDTYLANFTIPGVKEGAGTINETVSLENYNFTGNEFFQELQTGKIVVYVTAPHNGTLTLKNLTLVMEVEKNLLVDGIKGYCFNVEHSTIYGRDVYVDVDYRNRRYLGINHNMFNVMNGAHLYFLNLTINDTGKEKREDTAFLFQDSQSEAYILRYVVAKVSFHNHPIDGLHVYATPYPVDVSSDSQLISKIVGVISSYISETQHVSSMSIGHISGNSVWDITKDGKALLPLLSDILNNSEMPNSKFVGIYNVEVKNTTKEFAKVQIGLNYFPWLLPENNSVVYNLILKKYQDVDLQVVDVDVLNEEPYISGEDVKIKVKVENLGNDKAVAPMLAIYINDLLYENITLPDINGKDSYENTYVLSGNYFANADIYHINVSVYQIWDYELTNNWRGITISVGDIYAKNWVPSQVIRYHTVNVSLTLTSTYQWDDVKVSLYLDNQTNLIGEHTLNLQCGDNPLIYQWDVGSTSAGNHTLLLYVNSKLVGIYHIDVRYDVDLQVVDTSITPSEVYVGESVTISTNVENAGKDVPSSAKVIISLYDPLGNLISNESFTYPSTYQLGYTPELSGTYTVQIKVISSTDYNITNNKYSFTFVVNPVPYSVSVTSSAVYYNGTDIVINVTVYSELSASLNVNVKISELGITLQPEGGNPVNVEKSSTVSLQFILSKNAYKNVLQGKTSVKLTYYVRISSDRTGDALYSFGPNYLTIKEIADLEILPGSFVVELNGKNVTQVAEKVTVTIRFTVENVGGLPATLSYILGDGEKILVEKTADTLNPGEKVTVEYNYTVDGVGTHNLKVELNPQRNVTERNYENNNATLMLKVIPPTMEIVFTRYSEEHGNTIYQEDNIIILVKVINKNATESSGKTVWMSNVTVYLDLGNLGRYSQMTNKFGVARFVIPAKNVGSYAPLVTVEYYGAKQSFTLTAKDYKVVVEKKPLQLPWLWIIIGAIVAGVGGFFLYGFLRFKKKAKEYMICGNCGRLVPADAERCPYCGVVFEREKVKCPECGSWIDEDSKYCPVCGALFMDKEDPEYDKYSELKGKYDKYIEKYKTEAKKYIGEEYTTEEFFKWWKTHPEFISFQEWIKRQEERVEGETVVCPVCGAVNPKGAKICRVCGSPLPVEEEKKEEERTEEEEGKIKPLPLAHEEMERLKRPGVVTVEEWAKKREEKKEGEKREEEKPAKEEEVEEKKEEKKPIVKKKVIKKVIALEEKEKKEES